MSSGTYRYARCVMGDRMNRSGRECGRPEILRAPPGAVVLLVAAAALAGASREAAGQCHYTYVTLPNPPGWSCQAFAINNRGWVTGQLGNAGDNYRAFVWTPETGTTMLPMPAGYSSQTASDINDHGHVVGSLLGPAGSAAFFWDGAAYTIIPHPPWANIIEANGLNNQDQVVGWIHNNNVGPKHAFLWQDGVLTDLTPGIDDAVAESINELGVIAGYTGASTAVHAFVLDTNGMHPLPEPNPILGSRAHALNNNGFVVGDALPVADLSDPEFRRLGSVWNQGSVDLTQAPPGTRDAIFASINDAGRATGRYERPSGIIAWQNGVTQNLRPLIIPSAPSRVSGRGINNAGKIVAVISGGSVVLTPVWVTGDLTGDCHVTIEDLITVLSNFGSPPGSFPQGDVDVDGDVDLSDLAALLSNWGA